MPETTTPRPESRKVCLYLGDVAAEIDAAATKLGVSRSQLLVRAWQIAKAEIAAVPELPIPTH